MPGNLNKKQIFLLVGIFIVVLVIVFIIYYFIQQLQTKKEQTLPSEEERIEKALEDTTAPQNAEVEPVPQEVINNLSVPPPKKTETTKPKTGTSTTDATTTPIDQVPDEIIDKLTAPSN